ncbi:MAG: hypothetical protein EOP09_18140, partial [Proteobacteria bacterium]
MSRLVSQTHSDFVQYFKPDGGLCGPTCILNSSIANSLRRGEEPLKSTSLMNMMNAYYFGVTNVGIELGTHMTNLGQAAQMFYRNMGYADT